MHLATKTKKVAAKKAVSPLKKQAKRNIATAAAPKKTTFSASPAAPAAAMMKKGPVNRFSNKRFMSVVAVECPPLGDSVLEGDVIEWKKNVGDWVNEDDALLVLETAKVSVDIPAPKSGILKAQFLSIGDVAKVGDKLCEIDTAAAKPAGGPAPPKAAAAAVAAATAPAPAAAPAAPAPAPAACAKAAPKAIDTPQAAATASFATVREDRRVKMTRMRQTIAQRLKETQNTTASLTTFNEIDMTKAFALRSKFQEDFTKKHGVKLGFMSIFMAAVTEALKQQPEVNAAISGNEVVYRNYVDISVAVATPNGLVVPVVRDCQTKSLAEMEKAVGAFAKKARDGTIAMEDFVGGNFTISNTMAFGSMFGTPIINGQQSAILGINGIQDRPIAVDGKVEIRKMMYVALSYDHRMLDGKDAVTFLRTVKRNIEDPERMLLDM